MFQFCLNLDEENDSDDRRNTRSKGRALSSNLLKKPKETSDESESNSDFSVESQDEENESRRNKRTESTQKQAKVSLALHFFASIQT